MNTMAFGRTLATLTVAASLLGTFSAQAGEMYYNRLSTGKAFVPPGEYGDIVVPPGGFKATRFVSEPSAIIHNQDDFGGSFAGVIQQVEGKTDLMTHTVSGWFKVPASEADVLLFAELVSNSGSTSHAGNRVVVTPAGKLKVGKTKWPMADNGTVTSTDTVPVGKWFYLTVAFTGGHLTTTGERTSSAKAFVNGVQIDLPAKTFASNYNPYPTKFYVGDDVTCAGLRIDDEAVTDPAAIRAWATDERYVVRNRTFAMPYESMGFDPLDTTTGTFVSYDDQLAFPGRTLRDVDINDVDMIGTFTGAYAQGAEKGIRFAKNQQQYLPGGKLTKTVFSVNTKNAEYGKGIVLVLANGTDGVHVQVPSDGARSISVKSVPEGQDPIDTVFAELDTTNGTVTLKETKQKLVTTEKGSGGYALRGLTATRFMSKDGPILAFEDATVEDIKNCEFEGYTLGSTIKRGLMRGYNAKVTEMDAAGKATKLRVEMQMIEDQYVKCIVLEFTDGERGVYVKQVKALYMTSSDLGRKFVKDDGTYDGTGWNLVYFYGESGYGVFAITAAVRANTATWTGAAGDGDPTNKANWLCYDDSNAQVDLPDGTMSVYLNGSVNLTTASDKTFAAKEIFVGQNYLGRVMDAALAADCDWTYLPVAPTLARDSVLDLNGHTLTVARLGGEGTVTSSAANGVLAADVAEGWQNETVGMTGTNLVFRKTGAGTYVNGLATSPAVCEIVEGAVKLGNAEIADLVRVGNGATLDVNGVRDTGFRLILRDGATLTNTGAALTVTYAQLKQGLELEAGATAYLDVDSEFRMVGKNYGAVSLHLNGGTLVKRGSKFFEFSKTTVYGPGKIQVAAGTLGIGWNTLQTSDDPVFEVCGDAQLKVRGAAAIPTLVGACVVSADKAGHTLSVSEFCGPVTFAATCPTLALGDGATLDLSATTDCYDARNFTFGETAFIKIKGRAFTRQGEQVLSWDTQPATTFTWDLDTPPAVSATGIFYSAPPESTEVARAYWTNAAGDGDAANPANWACTNLAGRVVSGGMPGATSTVVLTGAVDFYLPADKPLACAAVEVADGVLVADCDWRGLGGVPFAGGTFIDLNGHTLKLAGAAGRATVTNALEGADNVGWLVFNIAADVTVENGGVAVQGNVLVVKDGEGTFVARKAGQTYSAGTCVRAGVLRLGGNEDAYHFLGVDGSPLTVEADGALDINGGYGMYVHPVTLAGGTLCNGGANQATYTKSGFGNVTLTADSRAVLRYQVLFSHDGAVIDLGGHTLAVEREADAGEVLFSIDGTNTVVNGTLACGEGVRFHTRTADVDLSGVSLAVNFAWNRLKGIAVGDYESNFASTAAPAFSTAATVTGRFKTDGRFDNVVLADGATLDLGGLDGALATTSAVAKCSLAFADGATVKVDIGNRTTARYEKLISWETKPKANFALADGQAGTLVMQDDGLWYRTGLMLFIR